MKAKGRMNRAKILELQKEKKHLSRNNGNGGVGGTEGQKWRNKHDVDM